MPVALSCHAAARLQQRAIPPVVIDLLEEFGETTRSHGRDLLFFSKASRQKLLRQMGNRYRPDDLRRWLNAYAVVGDDGTVVTASHRRKRIWR